MKSADKICILAVLNTRSTGSRIPWQPKGNYGPLILMRSIPRCYASPTSTESMLGAKQALNSYKHLWFGYTR